jgi:hypothetical protein
MVCLVVMNRMTVALTAWTFLRPILSRWNGCHYRFDCRCRLYSGLAVKYLDASAAYEGNAEGKRATSRTTAMRAAVERGDPGLRHVPDV